MNYKGLQLKHSDTHTITIQIHVCTCTCRYYLHNVYLLQTWENALTWDSGLSPVAAVSCCCVSVVSWSLTSPPVLLASPMEEREDRGGSVTI